MSLVTTIADDEPATENLGDLGNFRIKKLTKFIKPLTSVAKPLLSMGKGGGLLTAMGPWGWAAGAALAVGGTAMGMAARHQKKKRLARERKQQEQAAAAAPGQGPQPAEMQPMMMPGYEQPGAETSYPSPDMPGPEAMTLPEAPAYEARVPGSDVAMPFPMTEPPSAPTVEIPEFQAVLDPEVQPAVDGLAADGQTFDQLNWRTVAFLAGLGLGGWWLLSNHKPTRSKRR